MKDQIKNFLIGIFVTAALAIIVFMIIFLHPYAGDEGQILKVRFSDIDKVSVGTRVLFAGKAIGEVTAIRELEEVRKTRAEKRGDIYVYELDLAVDSSVKVYNTDNISLRTSGLLGEKSISIDPEPPEPGVELRIVNDEILYADETGSVEETFKEFKEIADKVDNFLDLLNEGLQELKEKNVWDSVATTAENMSELTSRLKENWTDIDESITNISEATANAREITEKLNSGEGTIGKLVSSDDFYLRTTSLLSKGETIMDDMNHYGLLYHLDKGWQRLRARRLNLMQKLQTPQEFRNYFNDEVNQIQTSLSRVGMIVDKSERFPVLREDIEFQKVFTELIRRVETLDEALKMYNIELTELEVQKTELKRGG